MREHKIKKMRNDMRIILSSWVMDRKVTTLRYKFYQCVCGESPRMFKGWFIRSNFDPINIENFCVRDGICWSSHDPVSASNYFVTSSKNCNMSCFENFMPTSPQLDPAVAAIL